MLFAYYTNGSICSWQKADVCFCQLHSALDQTNFSFRNLIQSSRTLLSTAPLTCLIYSFVPKLKQKIFIQPAHAVFILLYFPVAFKICIKRKSFQGCDLPFLTAAAGGNQGRKLIFSIAPHHKKNNNFLYASSST